MPWFRFSYFYAAFLCEVCERKTTVFRPSKLPLLSILYTGVSWGLSRGVFSSPFQERSRAGVKGGLIREFWPGITSGLPTRSESWERFAGDGNQHSLQPCIFSSGLR
jgi:hypothetical protein